MLFTRRHLLLAAAAVPGLALANHDGMGKAPGAAPVPAPAPAPAPKTGFRPVTPPQPVEAGNKIEVIEFFQYTCPFCAQYHPVLEGWKKSLPADVQYRRIPISWDERNLPHVRIYYTLEALGKTDAVQDKVYQAIQVNKKPLLLPDEIADLMAVNGIDRKQWLDTYNSFSVAARTNRAGQVWRAYKVEGTPSMAVDGKFMTSPSMVGSREGSLPVLDSLIQRARAERQTPK